jgi:hypothetical protein
MKNALAISLLIIISAGALSCGPTSILLVNLKTNDLRYCPVVKGSDACIKRLEELGYIRANRLTRAQKASLGLSFPNRLIFIKVCLTLRLGAKSATALIADCFFPSAVAVNLEHSMDAVVDLAPEENGLTP